MAARRLTSGMAGAALFTAVILGVSLTSLVMIVAISVASSMAINALLPDWK